ncbi:MAG: hypothetical protein U1F26_12305 [Lysobacterales bacterium]
MRTTKRIQEAVRHVVTLLVAGRYDELERESKGRLSSQVLASAIVEYGRALVSPPADAFADVDVIEISGSSPLRYSVRFDLWTVEEGRSDLSLEFTLVDGYNERMDFELDNLHVL